MALTGCKTADAVIIFKKPPTGMFTMAITLKVLWFLDVMVTNLGVRVADILNSPEANVGGAGSQAVVHKVIDKMS